jgi:Protein of unknown function (DUF541)
MPRPTERGVATSSAFRVQPVVSTPRRFLGLGLALSLVAGAFIGAGAVLAHGPVTVTHRVALTAPVGGPPVGAAADGTGTTATGSAIAYPGYPGTPGLAPDHTIVVSGVGQANLAADGSRRAEATKTALVAALADAKAQADLIAARLNISITGVVSVSASVGDYGPIPYAVPMLGGSTTPVTPVPAPTDGVSLPQLSISVTVAYAIN